MSQDALAAAAALVRQQPPAGAHASANANANATTITNDHDSVNTYSINRRTLLIKRRASEPENHVVRVAAAALVERDLKRPRTKNAISLLADAVAVARVGDGDGDGDEADDDSVGVRHQECLENGEASREAAEAAFLSGADDASFSATLPVTSTTTTHQLSTISPVASNVRRKARIPRMGAKLDSLKEKSRNVCVSSDAPRVFRLVRTIADRETLRQAARDAKEEHDRARRTDIVTGRRNLRASVDSTEAQFGDSQESADSAGFRTRRALSDLRHKDADADGYVVDVYHLDDSCLPDDSGVSGSIMIEAFDENMLLLDPDAPEGEYESSDSDDSNREGHAWNDYPSTESDADNDEEFDDDDDPVRALLRDDGSSSESGYSDDEWTSGPSRGSGLRAMWQKYKVFDAAGGGVVEHGKKHGSTYAREHDPYLDDDEDDDIAAAMHGTFGGTHLGLGATFIDEDDGGEDDDYTYYAD